MAEAKQQARAQGLGFLEAWTRDDAWVQAWYEQHGFVRGQSYWHIYLEQHEAAGVLSSSLPQLKPIYVFGQYTAADPSPIQHFHRIHQCVQYVLAL